MHPRTDCIGLTLPAALAQIAKTDGQLPKRRVALFHTHGGKCFYCQRQLTLKNTQSRLFCTIDHIVPRQLEGPFCAACRDCNEMRGDMPAHNFLLVMHAIIEAQGGELTQHPFSRPSRRVMRRLWPIMRQLGRSN